MSDVQRKELHDLCVKKEQGNKLHEDRYNAVNAWVSDDVVPPVFQLGFGIVASLAFASGMAALRKSSRGHLRTFALLQETESPVGSVTLPRDYLQAFDRGDPVEDAEKSIYADRSLVDRDQVLAKMEECEDVFEGKNRRLYTQATRSLVGFSMSVKKQVGLTANSHVTAVTNTMGFPVVLAYGIDIIAVTSTLESVKVTVGFLYMATIVQHDFIAVSALLHFLANQASGRKASKQPKQRADFERCWHDELPAKQELVGR